MTSHDQQSTNVPAAQRAEDDLAAAATLAEEMGMQVGHVAQLRAQLAAAGDDDVATVAAEAAIVRSSLEAAAAERASLLGAWAEVPARIATLGERELRIRAAVAASSSEQPVVVPSVDSIEHDGADLSTATWAAARARVAPVLMMLDRVEAELAEAERTLLERAGGSAGS